MDKQAALVRIEKLKKEIEHHRYLYHVLDKQEISDAALDSLKHELYELERQFPEYVTWDSPTQRVGGRPLAKFKKVTHSRPILSLEDVFNIEELATVYHYPGGTVGALTTQRIEAKRGEPPRELPI